MVNNIITEAESKLNKEKLNLGNLTNYYTNILDDDNIKRNYETLSLEFLYNYYDILFENIEVLEYLDVYKYKPEYVAYQVYGTASYDYLVLYANNIHNKKDFIKSNLTNHQIKYFSVDIVNKIEDEMNTNPNKSIGKDITVENFILYKI